MVLEDKVIIITGASSGIGAATARLLSRRGMKCVLTARSRDGLEKVAGDLDRAAIVVGDITDPGMPRQLIDSSLDAFGRVDAVFNNAGVMHVGSVDDADLEALCAMVRLNFEAVVRMSYTSLRHFKRQGSGFLINTSSLAGLKSFPSIGPYCGTKFAVEALTEALRMEMAGTGVKVAAIEPGRTRTGLFDHWREDQKFDPSQGMIEPEAIARAVGYILEQPDDVLVSRMLIVPASQPR